MKKYQMYKEEKVELIFSRKGFSREYYDLRLLDDIISFNIELIKLTKDDTFPCIARRIDRHE